MLKKNNTLNSDGHQTILPPKKIDSLPSDDKLFENCLVDVGADML
jgi:hypothetical protein